MKRKNLTQLSINNQSQQISQIEEPDINYDDLKQYPIGEMLLREEEMQNSMMQGDISSNFEGMGRLSNG